ncbi:hypothetical protein PFISCL1PPCAC_23816 [Pristionchus fissidentatus]|uniref:G protein-coupled receptor n=1 Tax=Pristionchus fissidentatus TaxID=1538716 RepID=A0AAV5WP90_9BILA|nr:hypothetical protein PFISCL1PPCAC_23816 [Pristionchus fissidentatus]
MNENSKTIKKPITDPQLCIITVLHPDQLGMTQIANSTMKKTMRKINTTVARQQLLMTIIILYSNYYLQYCNRGYRTYCGFLLWTPYLLLTSLTESLGPSGWLDLLYSIRSSPLFLLLLLLLHNFLPLLLLLLLPLTSHNFLQRSEPLELVRKFHVHSEIGHLHSGHSNSIKGVIRVRANLHLPHSSRILIQIHHCLDPWIRIWIRVEVVSIRVVLSDSSVIRAQYDKHSVVAMCPCTCCYPFVYGNSRTNMVEQPTLNTVVCELESENLRATIAIGIGIETLFDVRELHGHMGRTLHFHVRDLPATTAFEGSDEGIRTSESNVTAEGIEHEESLVVEVE